MKRARYLVFSGYLYYPSGGADDLVARISEINLQEIANIVKDDWLADGLDWLHVYDSEEGKIILRHTIDVSLYEESTGTRYVNFTKIIRNMK